MATIKLNREKFEKEIGKLDDKMQEKISLFGTPLETFNDKEIEIEVFPNRPDMLSYEGFKRSFLCFLGKKTGLKEYKLNPPEKDFTVIVEPSVKNIRPYTVCAIVKDLKLDGEKIKEIIEMQEKLHATLGRKRKKLAIGIYPLEKIKLPITYKALEPDKIKFIPLESIKEMSGLEILQKHSAGKDHAHLLAGKEKFPIFIDDNKNILSMPPIINSQLTGKVTEETKDLFVECSGFDPEILGKCLNIITTSLIEMGGKAYQMEIKSLKKQITPDLTTEKMKISLENVNKLLGLDLNEKQVNNLLEKMGYNYNKGIVEIPSWRVDVLHEVDLIEDVAIAYGYENFIPEIPSTATIGSEDKKEKIKSKISEILAGLGMLEVSNYHLTNKTDQFIKMNVNEKNRTGFVEVKGSKTDYTILRKNLTHYLLKNFSENIDSEYPQKIFELGKIFHLNKSVIEEENLAAAITPGNFTELKQALEYLFKMIDKKIKIVESKVSPNHFIEGRSAEIVLEDNDTSIGHIGEIHPKILTEWRIKMPVALFEINLDKILDSF